jgi:hypothetical protein
MSDEQNEDRKGQRPYADVRTDLQKPIPDRLIHQKKVGNGRKADYVPWYSLQKMLDFYTNGHFDFYVIECEAFEAIGKVRTKVRVVLRCADHDVSREGVGEADFDGSGFGDPFSNSEAQAFRRACARHGLGLDLWAK